ncbi:MAG TPA: DUF4203 domain-containing protein [Candidatus Limnocylindria bacterium]|jgi:hypothetical protein
MDLQALLVGIVAIALGAAMMLLGYRLALILLPIWGFFAGFIFGAQVLQEFFGDGFLATTASWVVGVVIGLLFAVLSYLFWYVAVVILFASIGYWLGFGFMTLIGFSETGLVAIGIGLLLGAVFAVAAFVTGVPLAALVVIMAIGGAHALIAGILVLIGTIPVEDLGTGVANAIIMTNAGWWLVALGLAVVSIIFQLKTIGEYVLEPPAARI